MELMRSINSKLAKIATAWAVACLVAIIMMVVYAVIMRYVFNDAPSYAEPFALLMVINVAFFGAAAVVRDEGHIGMESFVILLPKKAQYWIGHLVGLITLAFAFVLIYGGTMMVESVYSHMIPILGVSEAWRYMPSIIGGVLIVLFSIEHIAASWLNKK